MDANAINVFDAWLLGHLAGVAAQMGVAGSRGRMGLTTPAVVDEIAGWCTCHHARSGGV